jgi:hypothetical protein
MIEHRMDIDRFARQRALVGEHFHLVDEVADAIGLGADQPGERAVVLRFERRLDQLRRAADARQRVLDLVGQHAGEAGDGAGRAAMGELAIELEGDRALLHQQDHRAGLLAQRRQLQVDDAFPAGARRADVHAVFIDRRLALAHLGDEPWRSGLANGMISSSPMRLRLAALAWKKFSAAELANPMAVARLASVSSGLGSASRMAEASACPGTVGRATAAESAHFIITRHILHRI